MAVLRDINIWSILLRIALALAVGGILGIERGRRNRPAGFRTYMLVCLGATLVMMTNQYVMNQFGGSDPVRMGAQVVSGIGFLGMGTIVMTGRQQVKGITTAAGLWAAACCGLAIGIGFYEGAIIGAVAVFLVMAALQRVDSRIREKSKNMELYIEYEFKEPFRHFIEYAREHGIEVHDVQMQKNKLAKGQQTSVLLLATSKTPRVHTEVLETLSEAPGVHYIEELH